MHSETTATDQKLESLFMEIVNHDGLMAIYKEIADILTDATKWIFGFGVKPTDRGIQMSLDRLFFRKCRY